MYSGKQSLTSACTTHRPLTLILNNMHDKKIKNIIRLNNSERYKYLIRKVADFETIYLIYGDFSEMNITNINGKECILAFPEREFAEIHISQNSKQKVREVDLNQFIEWLSKDNSEQIKLAVFPNENNNAKIVISSELKNDLIKEREQYN